MNYRLEAVLAWYEEKIGAEALRKKLKLKTRASATSAAAYILRDEGFAKGLIKYPKV